MVFPYTDRLEIDKVDKKRKLVQFKQYCDYDGKNGWFTFEVSFDSLRQLLDDLEDILEESKEK